MSQVRRYAAAGLDAAARRSRRRRMAVGALDETGQEKQGSAHGGRETPVHGLRRAGRERDQHGAPVLRAGEDGPRADRRAAVDPGRGHRRPGEVPGHGPAAGPAVPHQGTAGHRRPATTPTPTGWRSTSPAGTRSTAAAPSCGSSWRTAGRPTCCGSRRPSSLALAAGTRMTCADAVKKLLKGSKALGGPLRRPGVEGRALVRLGLDRHRLPAAQPAGPPPPEDRRAGLSLLLRARRPGCVQGPADQGGGPALAGRGELRVREGLLRPGPVPGPALHRDPAAHRAGHGRPRGLRRHRRPAQGPHRRPGTAARQAGRQAARATPA